MIRESLRRANGNKSQAARLLGLSRNALRYRLSKIGIADEGEKRRLVRALAQIHRIGRQRPPLECFYLGFPVHNPFFSLKTKELSALCRIALWHGSCIVLVVIIANCLVDPGWE